MHPYYEPSANLLSDRRTTAAGVWSMAAYLAFWAAAIPVALVMLRRALARTAGPADTATAILRERFARGEIDADEYQHRTEVLRRG